MQLVGFSTPANIMPIVEFHLKIQVGIKRWGFPHPQNIFRVDGITEK